MRKTRLCIKPQPGFCSAFDMAATRKPATSQQLTENSKTDEQKSYSRPYRDGRECCSPVPTCIWSIRRCHRCRSIYGISDAVRVRAGTAHLRTGAYDVRGVLKANLVFLVLSLAACLVVVYPLASAMFG